MKSEARTRIAKRMQGVNGEAAFEMLARANELEAQGRSIIHLEIGEPDFDTPQPIVLAGIEALRKGATHYAPVPGIPELRRTIARHLTSRHGVEIDPRNLLISPGAKMMIFAVIQTLVDAGDEVIYPAPVYPAYEAAIRIAGATPVPVVLEESREFRFSMKELARKVTHKTKMVIINTPQNPTGGVLTLHDLMELNELADKHDLMILSDEIYSDIYYDKRPASMLDVPNVLDRLIFVHGFSKAFAMTGWRLGFSVLPRDVVGAVGMYMNNSVSSTSTFTQHAALAAFTEESAHAVGVMVEEFRKRRDVLVDGLNSIQGIRCLRPQGAFYVFPNITGLGRSSKEIADRLLNESGVSLLPGTAFGEFGEGYLRLSFANSLANLETALERIRKFAEKM